MKNLPFSLLMVVALLAVFSCQDANIITQDKEPAAIRMVDGRISFPTHEAFRETIQKLAKGQNNKGENSLDAFEATFPGFVSMRTAYDQLTEKDVEQIIGKERMDYYSNFVTETGEGEEREITCVIGDPILATVVNQKGWLQIGTDLYKFKYDKLVLLTSSSSARVAQVDAGSESGSDMILGKVIRRSQPLGNNARLASSDYCLDEYWISNGLLGSQKRRMAGVIEYTEYFHPNGLFYSDVDLYVKHQKRVLGVSWWEVNAPQLGINWSITMDNFSQPSYTETGSVSSDNDGLIRISYPSFCVTGPNGSTDCGRVFSRISTGNWVLCSDGIRRQCYLSK